MGYASCGQRARGRPGACPLLLALSLALFLPSDCDAVQHPGADVEVRVTDHRAGIGDFRTLQVQLTEVSLHRRGEPRDKGWVELVRSAPAVDIVPLKDGRSAIVAVTRVETGRYDAVRVRFGEVRGELRRGGFGRMAPMESTVAVDLAVESAGRRFLLIDLYVEDQSDHQPGLYAVKVQDVRIGTP
jgi:hypothetical protein